MSHQTSHICIISGELSGDIYAADLIDQIKKLKPNASFSGISGPLAHRAGLYLWPNCRTKSIMGFIQVLIHYFHYKQLLKKIEYHLRKNRPQLLILIDYAGLNLKVAKIASLLHIKVFYFIPPKVWAWGQHRLKKIQKFVDCVALLYPFELDYFSEHGIQSFLVSHPFLKKIPTSQLKENPLCVALLPGSRMQEIRTHLPIMLESCYLLLQKNPSYQFKILCSEEDKKPIISQYLNGCKSAVKFELITHDNMRHLQACRMAIACSGTATFECAMLKVPMIIVYRTNAINYWLLKLLIRVKWVGLPNLILQRSAFIELLQSDCTPMNISKHAHNLIQESINRKKQCLELNALHQKIKENPNTLSISETLSRIFQEHLDFV